MQNTGNEKLVAFTEEGIAEVARECYPNLSQKEALDKLTAFVSWIISK